MYEERYIAFIDLLGFGTLVEKSSYNPELPQKILSALLSLQPQTIEEDAYASINHEIAPNEEIENIKAALKEITAAMKSMHPVTITYFSDSLVLSAKADDIISSQMILDMLAKLSIKIWSEHSLLIRGGITKGKLIHIENGPLFGPAMNKAYYLESKLAVNPRILMDSECYKSYKAVKTFNLFESLFEQDGEYYYASLGTAFRHIINDSSLVFAGERVLGKFRESLEKAPRILASIEASFEDDRVKSKYQWLISEIEKRSHEIRQP